MPSWESGILQLRPTPWCWWNCLTFQDVTASISCLNTRDLGAQLPSSCAGEGFQACDDIAC